MNIDREKKLLQCFIRGYAIASTFPDTWNQTPETKFSEQDGVKSLVYVHQVTGEFSPPYFYPNTEKLLSLFISLNRE